MQEYWERYIKPVDGHKAMVSFNASVADFVPDRDLMYVGFMKLKLHMPREDGLVNDEESNDVGFIEDRLEMESLRYRIGKYIGRIISAGEVTFIYSMKSDFAWQDVVHATMEYFKEYTYEFGSRLDSEWEVYQKLLFPTTREWQIIANHHSCDRLMEQGDTLKKPRAIEHKAYFQSQDAREAFVALIEQEGFVKQKEIDVPFNAKTMFGLSFYRADIPFYYDIDTLSMHLIDLCESCKGHYDGWESSLVK